MLKKNIEVALEKIHEGIFPSDSLSKLLVISGMDWQKIYLFGILPLPGVVLGPLYLYFEYTMSKRGGTNINHDAHFYGALFGIIFTIALDPSLIKYFIGVLLNPPF